MGDYMTPHNVATGNSIINRYSFIPFERCICYDIGDGLEVQDIYANRKCNIILRMRCKTNPLLFNAVIINDNGIEVNRRERVMMTNVFTDYIFSVDPKINSIMRVVISLCTPLLLPPPHETFFDVLPCTISDTYNKQTLTKQQTKATIKQLHTKVKHKLRNTVGTADQNRISGLFWANDKV